MAWINQFPYSDFHELNLDWLIAKTKETSEQIKELQEEFAKIQVLTEDQINAMINYAITTNNEALYSYMANLKAQITAEYTNYVNNQVTALKIYVDNQDVHYDELAQSYASNALIEAKHYTDAQVLSYTMMINPITGEYQDVRDVVNDIVYYFHTQDSLTAAEYDALDLTASAYDAYELTAYDYDFNGKNLLV